MLRLFQSADFFGDIDGGIILDKAQLFDLGFEVGNRLLEI